MYTATFTFAKGEYDETFQAMDDEIAQLAKSSTAMVMVALRTHWRAWHFQRSRMCLALLAKQSRVRAEMKPR